MAKNSFLVEARFNKKYLSALNIFEWLGFTNVKRLEKIAF